MLLLQSEETVTSGGQNQHFPNSVHYVAAADIFRSNFAAYIYNDTLCVFILTCNKR